MLSNHFRLLFLVFSVQFSGLRAVIFASCLSIVNWIFSPLSNSFLIDSILSIAASYVNKGVVLVPDKLTCAEGKDIDIHPLNGIETAISFKNYLSS